MSKVYIVGAKRTAVGSLLGTVKGISPADLGATVVKQLLVDTGLDGSVIDEVITGNILSAGHGQGVGRQVAIKAGIPQEVPAYSLNMICGSGMKSVLCAVEKIKAGYADLVIAGGTESMSQAPFLTPLHSRSGIKMGNYSMTDHMVFDALTDAFSGVHMGITAENIADKYNISREQQDEFAINSQHKAISAVDGGAFKNEIVPVPYRNGKVEGIFDTDEYPNRGTTLEKLAKLRPAFKAGGSVTAGNASGCNDGASYCVVASEEAVKKYNLKPLVEVVSIGQGGVDPQLMGLGPVPAIKQALSRADLKLSDMEVLELNEAFASQSLGVVAQLSVDHGMAQQDILDRTNKLGGAIALGHPVGASGNRILVTLIHQILSGSANIGLASLCIGGGMGTAIIVKKA